LAIDENVKQIPNMMLPQYIFQYDLKLKENDTEGLISLKKSIMGAIEEDNMDVFYQTVCTKFGWTVDDELLKKMREQNEKDMQKVEEKHRDAVENAGDMEVLDSLFEKARLYLKIGDVENAFTAYDTILKRDKTTTGKKIDAMMEKSRMALFQMDMKRLKDCIAEAKKMIEAGGDWDRRNRLKVYEALYLIACREIGKATELLLECIATFSCTEVCSYEQFIEYAVITSMTTLPRTQLRKQLVKNPQVMTALRDIPSLKKLVMSLYDCSYDEFFRALMEVHPKISHDRYLGPHHRYLVREFRVLAYAQFLEAYRSVMLSSMALAFGISVGLLDQELSRFISAGRLNAKIDKVGDVIETSRPDKKNAQYQDVIKKGDSLLNHIQKLARLIDV